MKQPDLSIVIPAYHEEKRIGGTLDQLSLFLKHDNFFKNKEVEVLVVAAESADRTHQIVLAEQEQFKRLKLLKPGTKVGKGRDVQFGMLRAKGKIVIFMDADLATPLHHLDAFYKSCIGGNDIVIGTRNLSKYRPNVMRRLISILGNVLFRIVSGIQIEDSQCGFKMFNEHAKQICFTRMTILGWGFDMEVLSIARENNLKIKRYRINDWKDVPNSTFMENVFITSLNSIKDLTHIAVNRLKGS